MDWRNVIFSNEKHLNLGRQDSFNCYFHDFKKAKGVRWNRRFKRGGSLMKWGVVSANIKTDLVVPNAINIEAYIKILNVQLLLYCEQLGGKNFIFQQDRLPHF